MQRGIVYGFLAYGIWGLLPVYWKALAAVSSFQILCHRMVWSLVFILIILLFMKDWGWIARIHKQPVIFLIFLGTSLLLALNWGTYIWAVNSGHIIESSLGYFINPIVAVLLGVFVLRETLRPWQRVAVILAAAGVLYLTLRFGRLPWIALVLAFSFAFYGLIRKTAPLNSIEGLSLETAILFLPALGFLIHFQVIQAGAFGNGPAGQTLLLALSGPATALPLLLFGSAARRIPYSLIGLLQYVAPTLQFLIGVFLYHEPFSKNRLIGFLFIWTALCIYAIDGFIAARRFSRIQHQKSIAG
ncbi:MAG TPA: EamA family transporter RarD [bacterium]|nr:EamA family transporter RarD [bacterium]